MNDKPFEYYAGNGTIFKSDRCDFKNGVKAIDASDDKGKFAQDVAEMIGYHYRNIWPKLNGFTGYDAFEFQFSEKG